MTSTSTSTTTANHLQAEQICVSDSDTHPATQLMAKWQTDCVCVVISARS